MRWQFTLLLALNVSFTRAGPVHRLRGRSPKIVGPHYANTTSTDTSAEEASSTSSIETISASSDPAIAILPPSRITTSADEPVNEQKNGVNISPEGFTTEEEKKLSTRSITSSLADETSHASPTSGGDTMSSTLPSSSASRSIGSGDAGRIPRLPSPSDITLADSSDNGVGAGSSEASTKISTTASITSYPALSSLLGSAPTPSTTANIGGPALAAFQKARNSESPPAAFGSTDRREPSSTQTSVSATTIPVSAVLFISSVSTKSLTSTESFDSATSVSESRTELPISSSRSWAQVSSLVNPKATTFVGQIPPNLLDFTVSQSMTTTDLSASKIAQGISQDVYASAIPSSAQIAQTYNNDFRKLDELSTCDPSNADHVSACVQGKLAKCELDGTYSILSCDKGKSCYAVPKSNGANGIEVGCFSPNVAQNLIAPLEPSSAKEASATQLSAFVTSKAVPPTQTNDIGTSILGAEPQNTNTPYEPSAKAKESASVIPVAEAPETQEATVPDSPEVPSVAKESVLSLDANTFLVTTMPPSAERTSIADTPSAQSSSRPPHGLAALKKLNGQVDDQDQEQTGGTEQDNRDGSSSSGIQISLPGSKNAIGEQDDVSQQAGNQDGNKKSIEKEAKPETNQKNAVAANKVPFSPSPALMSTPLAENSNVAQRVPTATADLGSSTNEETPGVTVAPALSLIQNQGFITVTVTRTTTVHDRD